MSACKHFGWLMVLLALLLAACGSNNAPATATLGAAPNQAANAANAASPVPAAPVPAGASAPTAAPGVGARLLNQPDNLQLVLLGWRLSGKTPPLQEWAAQKYEVTSANEFERPAKLKAELERLQTVWDGTADVGSLRFNVDSRFSEYDATRGGYYLDAFTPGSYFDFSASPGGSGSEQHVSLRVDNAGELNFWPLAPAAAQDILSRNGNARDVVLDSQFRIVGTSQHGDATAISLQLLRYSILSDRYNQQGVVLGERAFGP